MYSKEADLVYAYKNLVKSHIVVDVTHTLNCQCAIHNVKTRSEHASNTKQSLTNKRTNSDRHHIQAVGNNTTTLSEPWMPSWIHSTEISGVQSCFN